MLGLLAGFRWFSDPRFMGATRRARSRAGSGSTSSAAGASGSSSRSSPIVLSVLAIGFKGLEPRHRLQGRRPDHLHDAQADLALARAQQAAAIGESDAVVQGRGHSDRRGLLQELPDPAEEAALAPSRTTLTSRPRHERRRREARRQERLGELLAARSSTARSSRSSSRSSLIALYVTLPLPLAVRRPDPAHTASTTSRSCCGVYAISGREVTADTVAAVLTILGYSVYDTIIVFDRVRENMRLMPKASIATIANVSVSEVLEAVDRHLDDHAAPDRRALHLRRRDAAATSPSRSWSGSPSAPSRRSSSRRRSSSGLMERDPEYAGRRGEAYDATVRARACSSAPSAPRPTSRRPRRRSTRSRRRSAVIVAAPAATSRAKRSARAAASGGSRGRMDDPGNDVFDEQRPARAASSSMHRAAAGRAALAARRGGLALARRRGAARRGEPPAGRTALFYELGLITREDWDELDLRVAQLEHRAAAARGDGSPPTER